MADYRFQHRRTTNPASTEVLLLGEWGVEHNGAGVVTGVKIGDGVTQWASLPFVPKATDIAALDTRVDTLESGTPVVGARATRGAAYSLVNATLTDFPWDGEDWDTDGFHNTVTNNERLTVPVGKAGTYVVVATVAMFEVFASGRFFVSLRKNGADMGGRAEVVGGTNYYPAVTVSTIAQLVAGDYVTANYYQDSGTGKTVVTGSCTLQMARIGI